MFTLKYLVQLLALVGVGICMVLGKYMEGVLTFAMATILDHIIDMELFRRNRR